MQQWEITFEQFLLAQEDNFDAAHDVAHIHRVVKMAKALAAEEEAQLEVVVPAAWLHDCVTLPKTSPRRSQASRLAAEQAGAFLLEIGYAKALIPAIQHAIAAHSFSAQIPPQTIEAKVVQDADRLDAIGAVGVARCLMLGAEFGIPLYNEQEPIPQQRPPQDKQFVIDHFYTKLFKLQHTMQTAAGRTEAQRRTAFMEHFITQLVQEIT